MSDQYITPDEGIRLCESILRQLEELDLQDQIAGVVLDDSELYSIDNSEVVS